MQGLPAAASLDAARAPLELATIFAPSWQFAGHVADLPAPGTAVRVDCGPLSAILLRTRDGQLRGFRNACRHRGARLIEGDAHTGLAFCVDGRLRCPYHGWTYDDSGALEHVPDALQFAALDSAAHALHPVHVAQWRGLLFVAFERPALDLAATLDAVAPGWPDLAPMRRLGLPRATTCAADWKLACTHLLDAGHADVPRPSVRPRVYGPTHFVAPANAVAIAGAAALADGVRGDTWSAHTYRTVLTARTGAAAARLEQVYLWPNLLLQLCPDGLVVVQVLPGPTGLCTLRGVAYGAPDTSREMRLLRYTHRRVRRAARRDDQRLLERVQQGLASLPADEAATLGAAEAGAAWFAAQYRAALGPPPASKPPARRRARRAIVET